MLTAFCPPGAVVETAAVVAGLKSEWMTTKSSTDAGISNPYSSQYTFTVLLSMTPVTLPSIFSEMKRTMSPILMLMVFSFFVRARRYNFFGAERTKLPGVWQKSGGMLVRVDGKC